MPCSNEGISCDTGSVWLLVNNACFSPVGSGFRAGPCRACSRGGGGLGPSLWHVGYREPQWQWARNGRWWQCFEHSKAKVKVSMARLMLGSPLQCSQFGQLPGTQSPKSWNWKETVCSMNTDWMLYLHLLPQLSPTWCQSCSVHYDNLMTACTLISLHVGFFFTSSPAVILLALPPDHRSRNCWQEDSGIKLYTSVLKRW